MLKCMIRMEKDRLLKAENIFEVLWYENKKLEFLWYLYMDSCDKQWPWNFTEWKATQKPVMKLHTFQLMCPKLDNKIHHRRTPNLRAINPSGWKKGSSMTCNRKWRNIYVARRKRWHQLLCKANSSRSQHKEIKNKKFLPRGQFEAKTHGYKCTDPRLSHLENRWTVTRRQTWPNPQTRRMQQTSGNTQTLEPKMLFWSSNSRGENSNKNMRKDPGRWRRFGRWREMEREEKIAPAQNESMEIGGLALSLLPNTSARWQSGKEAAPAIRTQDGGKSHSPANSRDLNRDLKTRDICFCSLTICVKSACPHLGL